MPGSFSGQGVKQDSLQLGLFFGAAVDLQDIQNSSGAGLQGGELAGQPHFLFASSVQAKEDGRPEPHTVHRCLAEQFLKHLLENSACHCGPALRPQSSAAACDMKPKRS